MGARLGHVVTEATKDKIRNTLKGRHCSPTKEFKIGHRESGA